MLGEKTFSLPVEIVDPTDPPYTPTRAAASRQRAHTHTTQHSTPCHQTHSRTCAMASSSRRDSREAAERLAALARGSPVTRAAAAARRAASQASAPPQLHQFKRNCKNSSISVLLKHTARSVPKFAQ